LPGISFSVAWGLKTVAVCPQPKVLQYVTIVANVLEGLASFVVAGIALIAVSLTYLSGAKERLIPVVWATLGGLFLAGSLASGLKLRSGHRSPVGITIQNMQLGFVALLFFTMSESTPGAALAHKTIALFFVVGNAQPDCGDTGLHARATRYLNFFTAAIFLAVIGGMDLRSDPIVLAEWQESWTEPNDSYWPVLAFFWASSLVTALWAVSAWVHKAWLYWQGRTTKPSRHSETVTQQQQIADKAVRASSAVSSSVVGLAWLGILIVFLATIGQMRPVVDVDVMLQESRAPFADSVDALTKFYKMMYWMTGVSLTVPWLLLAVSLCPQDHIRTKLDQFGHGLEAVVSFTVAGIATIAVALNYLDGARDRLLPLQWATIGGLFLSSGIAAGLRLPGGQKSHVGTTIQNMQLQFIGLLFFSMAQETPSLGLAHKFIGVLFFIGASQPDSGNGAFFARNARYLCFATAGVMLCTIGGWGLLVDDIVLQTWQAPWVSQNDSQWPILIFMWASSILVGLVAVGAWAYQLALYLYGKLTGKRSESIGLLASASRV
jgi:hypothetical protein